MTPQELTRRLREEVAPATPPPGLETRIQALARNQSPSHSFPWLRSLALPVLAVVVLVLAWPSREPPSPKPVTRLPEFKPISTAEIENPVRHEYEALKRDARWTASLFRSGLPSIPTTTLKLPK